MNPMQISQIVVVVVLALGLIVKTVENSELKRELELLEEAYKAVIAFKNMEINSLKSMLAEAEALHREEKP